MLPIAPLEDEVLPSHFQSCHLWDAYQKLLCWMFQRNRLTLPKVQIERLVMRWQGQGGKANLNVNTTLTLDLPVSMSLCAQTYLHAYLCHWGVTSNTMPSVQKTKPSHTALSNRFPSSLVLPFPGSGTQVSKGSGQALLWFLPRQQHAFTETAVLAAVLEVCECFSGKELLKWREESDLLCQTK